MKTKIRKSCMIHTIERTWTSVQDPLLDPDNINPTQYYIALCGFTWDRPFGQPETQSVVVCEKCELLLTKVVDSKIEFLSEDTNE